MTDPKEILERHQQLKMERSNFDLLWQEVAQYVLPNHAYFNTSTTVQGEKKNQLQYDSTAQIAAERHASAIDSLLTPRSSRWHRLTSSNRDLNEDDEVRQFFDTATNILFDERYSPRANFSTNTHDVFLGGGVFGNASLFVDDNIGGGIRYTSMPSNQIWFSVDAYGVIDRLHRGFQLTAGAAYARWGDKCSKQIKDCVLKANAPLTKFDFVHAIYPNSKKMKAATDYRSMPWASCIVDVAACLEMERGGYSTWPAPTYRYAVAPGEWYGRGWATQSLADIKMLNKVVQALRRQTEKAVDPPLLLHDDGMVTFGSTGRGLAPNLGAGKLTYNAVSSDGRPLVVPLMSGANIPLGKDEVLSLQNRVNDGALISLFQILIETPQMTATEVMARMNEKAQLIAPTVGRAQGEFLGAIIEREIDILTKQGKLPPPPDRLVQAAGEYRIEYDGPLSRLMRLEEVQAVERWMAGIVPLAQFRPDLLDNIEFDEMVLHRGRVLGVPEKIIADRDHVADIRSQRAQAQQAQQSMQTLEQGAGAASNLGNALLSRAKAITEQRAASQTAEAAIPNPASQ